MTTLMWWVLLPLLALFAVLLWATESREQRIRRLHKTGLSQAKIADRLRVSRYQVRKALA